MGFTYKSENTLVYYPDFVGMVIPVLKEGIVELVPGIELSSSLSSSSVSSESSSSKSSITSESSLSIHSSSVTISESSVSTLEESTSSYSVTPLPCLAYSPACSDLFSFSACSGFGNWELHGLDGSNTINCMVAAYAYTSLAYPGKILITVYESTSSGRKLCRGISGTSAGTVNLIDAYAEGVYGQVDWNGNLLSTGWMHLKFLTDENSSSS